MKQDTQPTIKNVCKNCENAFLGLFAIFRRVSNDPFLLDLPRSLYSYTFLLDWGPTYPKLAHLSSNLVRILPVSVKVVIFSIQIT